MSSNSILSKQLRSLIQNELPNIKVIVNEKDITKIGVIFYYKKTSSDDTNPYFLMKNSDQETLVEGELDLTNFPNKAPKLTLFGDLAHCHVHPHLDKYVICFSLDESYQWFFGNKHMQSSRFNPSVTVQYYLTAVYKFLAEDDREYEVGDDRRIRSLAFWEANKPKHEPTQKLTYNEALKFFNDNEDKKETSLMKNVQDKFGITFDIPENILNMRDFVDKELLLTQNDPILFCINYNKIGERHVYRVIGLDLMKESTFQGGIKNTSVGAEFNNAFPLVIHSKIWNKSNPKRILDGLVNKVFNGVVTNQIIKLNVKAQIFDHYLYIISELFNELAIDVFAENMFPCEEVLKGFVYLHHLLLVLEKEYPQLQQQEDKILDFFESNGNNRDKKICGNIGILMTQYLTSKKKRNINHLVDELLARNVLWSLKKPNECKECIGFNSKTNQFYITNINKWIDITWKNSYIGMQRFAFQQLYNNKFSKETLETMDGRFGQPDQKEIELFQKEVKSLCAWKNLDGRNGYKTFLDYFGLSDDTIEQKLNNAMSRSTSLGYHSFVLQKEWKIHLKSITNI
jgi:hypothetical protein